MAFLLSQNKIVSIPQDYATRFHGSSSFLFEDGVLISKKSVKEDKSLRTFYDAQREKAKRLEAALELVNRVELEKCSDGERTYKLNVKKVRARAWALFNTQQGQKFMSFITISFPMGLPDDDAFKAFNVFLTRCRKSSGLKNYIWVSERQKNGTIHFHMITTDYMPIREINNYMAVTLSKYFDEFKAQGLFKQYATAEEFKCKYNGIDVEQIRNCARQKGKLATYISKYISKGNAVEFTRLVWHCSRSVSALFTDLNITEDEAMQILDHMEETGHEPKELEVNPYVSVYYLNVPNFEKAFYQLPDEYLRDLYVVNTEILNGYDTGKYN